MTESERIVTGYMCRIDWDHEIGNASGGNVIFPSIKDLRRHHVCVDECGAVEVTVRIKRVVIDGTGEYT